MSAHLMLSEAIDGTLPTQFLIVIEAEGAGGAYHNQPYRLAKSVEQAKEMMREYMRAPEDSGALVPSYFALYQERDGEFGAPVYFDPASTELNAIDPIEWFQQTGRI